MKNTSDQQRVKNYLEGNTAAFEEIFDRYYKRAEYFFYKMLWNDKEKAEGYAQDLFLKVIEKAKTYNPELSFKTWLFSIANNMCKNEYRKKEVEDKSKNHFTQNGTFYENSKAEQKIDESTFLNHLFEALKEEPIEKKSAFLLKHLEFLSIKEISESLGIPEGTVKSGLHYTTKKLSKKLSHFKSIRYE